MDHLLSKEKVQGSIKFKFGSVTEFWKSDLPDISSL